ncbi:GTP-binding protein [Treponema primitia]|uniref:GTP-binding protein n=1 Tax=Treponema primitia TaxID=88058 RepID=UPI0005A2C825|nr:GTP-binding protein [Treponema primitia]
MKVIIVGGFLGSGKTSIVLQMAQFFADKYRSDKKNSVVIIENEIGEVGIDDKVLKNAGYQVQDMFSGCVCCTMSGELLININRVIKDLHPEIIIMEATGVAYPKNIQDTLTSDLHLDCKICCIADAKRWQRLQKPLGEMIKNQLDGADEILINKIDLVDKESLKLTEKSIRDFNETADVFLVTAMEKVDNAVWNKLID